MTPAQLKVILKYLEFFKREHGLDFEPWPIEAAIENLRKVIFNAQGLGSDPADPGVSV